MDKIISTILPVLLLSLLAVVWTLVQLLAKRLGTKNHIDQSGDCGKSCACAGGMKCKKETS